MKKSLLIISIILVSLTAFSQQNDKNSFFNEPYRPQFHFSPKENRMESPISIVKTDSVFNLYYQLNPENLQEGFVNWGHATSLDLIHWKHTGLSITQPENIADSMKFTPWWGSTTKNNGEITAWFNSWDEGIFKSTSKDGLAFSEKTKVENIDYKECEPFVFWHSKTQKWVMVAYNRADSTMNFLNSTEGTNWTKTSSFKYKFGFPTLIELPVDQKTNETRWMLLTEDGTYTLGNFDGEKFELLTPLRKFDNGRCVAGSICFNDEIKDRTILLSGLTSEQHPDFPSNGQLTFPSVVSLHEYATGIELVRHPIEEIATLFKKKYEWNGEKVYPGISNNLLSRVKETSFYLKGVIDLKNCDQFGFMIRSNRDRNGTEITYRTTTQEFYAPGGSFRFKPENNKIEIEMLVDRSSFEIYVDGGRYSISSTFVPEEKNLRCELFTIGGEIVVDHLEIFPLKSVWRDEK